MIKRYYLLIYILLATLIYGCPYPIIPEPSPTPTPRPPIPTIIPSPTIIQAINYKVEFGPGTKGPGTISDNLSFTVNFPDSLVQPALKGFAIKSLKVNDLILTLVKEDKNIITATVIPNQKSINFKIGLEPAQYKIYAKAEADNPVLEMSGSLIEIKQDFKTDVKVVLYTKNIDENSLDIWEMRRRYETEKKST